MHSLSIAAVMLRPMYSLRARRRMRTRGITEADVEAANRDHDDDEEARV